jgi:hypothetical protein
MKYLVGFLCGLTMLICIVRCNGNHIRNDVVRDTIFDTIKVVKPLLVESTIISHKVVTLPRYNTIVKDSVVTRDSVVLHHDSVDVVIPIEQKVYRDSLYTVWVSGYQPELDSIQIINQRISEKDVHNLFHNFSCGIQAGYGITPRGFQPYIGLGISFRFSFSDIARLR